ncbi:MAG: CPBP family intramembrane metalloprotease [Acidobacteriaceae bacterium]|nr:CPBP family intramembrane metalloprotease [Acidobacteriaceae bacterium]
MNSLDPDSADLPDSHGLPEQDLPSPPATESGFTLADLFFGDDGLRAGWGILLFLALRDVLADGVTPLLSKLVPHTMGGIFHPRRLMAYEGLALLTVIVATGLMARIERRPASAYGLGGRHRLSNFCAGLGWGVALLSLLVFSLRACGLLVFDERLLFGASALRYAAIWGGGFLLVGLFEETFFRGYLQFTLSRGIGGIYNWICANLSPVPDSDATASHMAGSRATGQNAFGFWSAALLLSFGFGFTHSSNVGESPIGLFSAALIAVVFCFSLWRSGSLWWAIGFHTAWDWAQSFLYGVSDSGIGIAGHLFATHPVGRAIFSGGLTGPEGSLFILPIIALTVVVIHLTLPRESSVDLSTER